MSIEISRAKVGTNNFWRRNGTAMVVAAVSFILMLTSCVDLTTASENALKNYEIKGGLWFDGEKFTPKTMYTVDGIFSAKKPKRIDERLDIPGKYVVPPLGEGHNHWLEWNNTEKYINSYLADGVFYVRDLSNSPYIVNKFRDRVNNPNSVDFTTTMQGFTGPGGHPLQIARQMRPLFPSDWPDQKAIDELMYVVDSKSDIDAGFAQLLKSKPDAVKAFLLYSDEYDARKDDPSAGFDRGMDPKLLPHLVRSAHDAGLKIFAHVQTGADVHNALIAGVDVVAHMPMAGNPNPPLETFIIAESDAMLAAKNKVSFITSTSWFTRILNKEPQRAERILKKVVAPNFAVLKKYGVKIILGSDQFRRTPMVELMLLSRIGVLSNLELLDMATVTTPRDIFPNRKIGLLKPGYEASFLVLNKNPLEDIRNLKTIEVRMKQGSLLTIKTSDSDAKK